MERPNYYAILSAEVRYDDNLRPNTKLLYAEITALCNATGECFATNKYFSNLYNKSKGTISGWISELVKNGYIKIRYTYKEGTKEIEHRYIKILKGGVVEKDKPLLKKTLKNNTKNNNNINDNNIIIREQKFLNDVSLLDYDINLKKEFTDYWTETNKSGSKMKFELQKTFDIKRRLARWCKNDQSWNKVKTMSKLDSQISAWQEAKKLL
tara:strand:- start:2073 stop:2702 length:630 start_codon:yes stop_codon:yes gene_type:complete